MADAFTLIADTNLDLAPVQELRAALEKGSDELKLATLTQIIVATLNGQPQPTLLMPIIQFVLPSKNKHIKKLLHFYWEICPKLDEQGKLKQEMILVWYVPPFQDPLTRTATPSATTSYARPPPAPADPRSNTPTSTSEARPCASSRKSGNPSCSSR